MPTTLLWLRNDLRVADHPALTAAAARGPVVPVFIWAPEEEGKWAPGGAARWWLHHSLPALDAALRARGSRLVLRRGPSLETLRKVIAATGADAVYHTRRYEPALDARDRTVAEALREDGLEVRVFGGALLHEPDELLTQGDTPYRVFGPFWRRFKEVVHPGEPLPPPDLQAPASWPDGPTVDELRLSPVAQDGVDWGEGLRETWTPGPDGAHARMDRFAAERLDRYPGQRARPDLDASSALSPHLHWGEVSPREVWHAVLSDRPDAAPDRWDSAQEKYLSELAWREFAYHTLAHFPTFIHTPLRPEYAHFPTRPDPAALRAWELGETGYPIVDAGMQQLWQTGWMHNRVRMIAASLLVKHLLQPWQAGARWFWDTLVDADLASNTMGWQWTAGSGPDAQPFFRIFNPVSQGERFDPDGDYVRRWLPRLAGLPRKYIHRPWEAPPQALHAAGVRLGETYPEPIVTHRAGRDRAMAAFEAMRARSEDRARRERGAA